MAQDPKVVNAMATEARRHALEKKRARIEGEMRNAGSLATMIAETGRDAERQLGSIDAELKQLDASDVSVVSSYGYRSDLDEALYEERMKGKAELVAYVRAHPDCPESDALAAFRRGAATELQNPAALLVYYRNRLIDNGALNTDAGWTEHKRWILNAPDAQAVGPEE